eukprot:CAMPEP_0176452408 /NCGR_PEP_ID=MMETSP0127-20121128/28519_1 /TAXON_ID=938130 /ORGANISM="Platyophrya macrostoma, Strain WH" /LENGTH=59 /DNA_ID=CAMNT_0017840859 /DNA_START=16 /DNA_END=192 /DNA_ORIENTATION=-
MTQLKYGLQEQVRALEQKWEDEVKKREQSALDESLKQDRGSNVKKSADPLGLVSNLLAE